MSNKITDDAKTSRPFMSLAMTMTVGSQLRLEAGLVEVFPARGVDARPELPEEFKAALAAEHGEIPGRKIPRSTMSMALDAVISNNGGRPSGNILFFPPEWETKQ